MTLTEQEAAGRWERNPLVSGIEWTHTPNVCAGTGPCCIHAPSDHPLNSAPLHWRGDRSLMERICEHGVGHPDPDDLAYKQLMTATEPGYYERFAFEAHGCDGCCSIRRKKKEK